jgi:hypothetical protein
MPQPGRGQHRAADRHPTARRAIRPASGAILTRPASDPTRPVRWLPRLACPGSAPAWQGEPVTDFQPGGWLTLPDVAERLDIPISRVHQMIRDHHLIAVRREGVRQVPAELVANQNVRKHLPGVLTLLRDAGYDDEAALRWLYQPDETLPGTPAVALAGDRAREVKRRAQALGV